jgi:hypothetical protein
MSTSPMVSFTTKSFQRLAAIACAALMLSTATVVADDVSVKQLESLVSAGDIDSAVSVARFERGCDERQCGHHCEVRTGRCDERQWRLLRGSNGALR